jgi:hypothetical protein
MMTQSNFHSDTQPNSDRMRDSQRMRNPGTDPIALGDAERSDLHPNDETTFDDPRIARERAEERERAEAREGAREQAELAFHEAQERDR